MLVLTLGMSINTAWAGGNFNPSSLPPEMIQTLMNPTYCAQLTGHASSTGGGKVYVNAPQAGQSVSADPRDTEYVEGTSNVAVSGMGLSMAGMTKIGINAWAKADPGYWFAGFSFSNMGTDLGTANPPQGEEGYMQGLYASTYDIGIQENETIKHVIYGTFEPIRIAGYEITGNTTTSDDGNGNMVCNLAVIFTLSGAAVDIDASDFKIPVVTGDGWSMAGWDYNTTNAGKITVNVHFTTKSTDVAEYAGSLKLETQATPAISMNVPLNARTAAPSNVEAIRYDKNKVKQGEGALAAMIAAAAPTDVIKLNKNYDGQVVATKSFTLDLNGYNIEYHYNTLRNEEFDEAAIAQAALLVYNPDAVVTIAYSPYGGEIIAGPFNDAADVFGKLILNGGTLSGFFGIGSVGVVEQNGATINASPYSCCAIASQGKVTITDGKMNAMVGSMGDGSELIINGGIIDNTVIEDPQSYALFGVQIGGGVCRINKGTIIGRQYGVQNAGGEISIEKLAVIKGGESSYALDCQDGTTTVNCGKFEDPAKLWDPTTIESRMNEGKAEFVSGYFQTNNQGEDEYWGEHVWRNTSGAEYREGYEFFVGSSESAKAAGVSVCHIGGTSYSALEDALAYANNTSEPVVIIMDNDYTLPAGYYTIPNNATLLIPKSNEQGAATPIVNYELSYTAPSLFRKLTLASGVNLDVFGTIEVSGTQYSGNSDQPEGTHTGAVIGDYAQLQMNKGSKITLQNNSVLRAWGYVTGDIENKDKNHNVPAGEIDVRRGANVYEFFQMGDWGNTVMNGIGLVSGDTRFPITSYFIQNVEVPAKYHPGGRLTSVTTVSASGAGLNLTMCANEIQIIGVTGVAPAMFLMDAAADAENTWVRKWYDASKDQQVYEINSGAHIGNLVINLASSPLFEGLESTLAEMDGTFGNIGKLAKGMGAEFHQDLILNSGQYVLPITSNFKLHLLSGTLDFTQSTELIPGSELEIDKEALVSVTDQGKDSVLEGSLYIYDWRDWVDNAAAGQPAQKILYTPSFDDGENNGAVPDAVRDVSTCEALGHAKVNVHGTFDTNQGYIFTSENGGDIFSSVEDAGTFKFTNPALLNKEGTDSIEVVKITTSYGGSEKTVKFYPAKLHNSAAFVANGGEEYQSTGGTEAGQSYCFIDFDGRGGQWKSLKQDDACFLVDEDGIYYAKPQEYVAVTSNEEDPITHTFSDLAGAGRLFINTEDEAEFCHWWEVEAKENYYHCIHPENDTYYEWDSSKNKWVEKKFTITWKDKNWGVDDSADKVLQTYKVSYGTQAEWLSTNPTRPASVDYTYDFTGWSPALGKVTSDVTYTATYEAKQIKYTITFVQDGGVEIERHLLARNEMPVCENLPTRTGYILEWSPALAAVTGNQTYTATWLPEPPEDYAITFFDYDGTTKLKPTDEKTPYMVAVGDMPTPPANVNGKPATAEYTYVFDHWAPALEKVSAKSAKSYTAVYREEARTYTISYYKEDGTTLKTSEQLPYGATPTPPDVEKENPQTGHTYTLVWKTLDASGTIQTVTGDASYKPTYIDAVNKYTVSVRSNPAGACKVWGSGIYDYNNSEEAIEIGFDYDDSEWTFDGWCDDTENKETSRKMAVTGDITLVANFTYKGEEETVTITWMSEDGETPYATVNQKEGTATTYTGATPTKEQDDQYAYKFYGWTTRDNEGNILNTYKNGMTPKATTEETYYACFTPVVRQYNVSLSSTPAGVCMLVGAGTYDYSESYENATVIVSGYDAVNYTFDGWFEDEEEPVSDEESYSFAVQGDVNLVAKFSPVTYTVTWMSEDGTSTLETDDEQAYGSATAFNGATPTKADHTFIGWTTAANGEGSFYAKDATPAVSGNATYYAYFAENTRNLEIGADDSQTLDEPTDYTTFTITSNGVNSGQLINADNLSLLGEAIFKLQPAASIPARTWYAVAAPWQVNVRTGIYAGGRHLNVGRDFDIIEFNAESYAVNEAGEGNKNIWKYVDEDGGIMQPGKLYMVYLASAQPSLEFHMKRGTSIITVKTSVDVTGGTGDKANWNAIANPALYHANINAGVDDYEVYNSNDGTYTVKENLSTTDLIVGQPIFVQVTTPNPSVSATVATGGGAGMPAYRRAPKSVSEADSRFVIEIARNGQMNDRLIVQTTDEKENTYVIGQDLAKMGVGTKTAQMWMERYNTKLCKNTVEMMNDRAEYPLTIFAPAAGEYILSAAQQRGNEELYLTRDGEAIWNLSESNYVLTLEKGTTARYGLRISVKKAPQVTTGMDEALVDAQGDTRKVLINDKVFIIRGDNVYCIDGQLVK